MNGVQKKYTEGTAVSVMFLMLNKLGRLVIALLLRHLPGDAPESIASTDNKNEVPQIRLFSEHERINL